MESEYPLVVVLVKDGYVEAMDRVAGDIAKSLKCSHLCLEDILDAKDRSDPESVRLGFDKACRIAITQLRSGQSVIINCLTSFSQFSMLKPLYDSPYSYNGDAFLILHFYFLLRTKGPLSDMVSRVSRLMVDTRKNVESGVLVKALNDLAYCYRGHALEWYEWKPFHGLNDHRCDGKRLFATIDSGEYPYSNTTHAITEFKQVRHGAKCCACLKEVSGEAYMCRCGCNVAMHRECLIESEAASKTPESLVQLLQQRLLGGYLFPELQRCKRCKAAQKDFSYGCQRCLFQTLVKSGLPATHSGDRFYARVLQAVMIPQSKSYRCEACGKPGSYAGYSCFQCNKHYHVGCVFMPLSKTHRHGGWEHQMDLQFKSIADNDEGTFCDFCYKDLDPNFWFYACKEGCYVTHIECVFCDDYDQEYAGESEACTQEDDTQCGDVKHIITYKHEVQGEPTKYCILCEKKISGNMCACEKCSFSLHVSCCKETKESLQTSNERALAFRESPVGYPFVKSHLCPLCQDKPSLMPYECGHCIFQTNLKHKEWPLLLHHKGHHDEHYLSFWAMPLPQLGKYLCCLCGKPGTLISYYSIYDRNFCFHINCLLN